MSNVDPIVQADTIRLVDDDFPTDKREMVAEYIDEHWNEQRGLSLTEIADETGTSRQHVKNTLEKHFEIADHEPDVGSEDLLDRDDLDIATIDLVLEAYRKGYQDGRRDETDSKIEDRLRDVLN